MYKWLSTLNGISSTCKFILKQKTNFPYFRAKAWWRHTGWKAAHGMRQWRHSRRQHTHCLSKSPPTFSPANFKQSAVPRRQSSCCHSNITSCLYIKVFRRQSIIVLATTMTSHMSRCEDTPVTTALLLTQQRDNSQNDVTPSCRRHVIDHRTTWRHRVDSAWSITSRRRVVVQVSRDRSPNNVTSSCRRRVIDYRTTWRYRSCGRHVINSTATLDYEYSARC